MSSLSRILPPLALLTLSAALVGTGCGDDTTTSTGTAGNGGTASGTGTGTGTTTGTPTGEEGGGGTGGMMTGGGGTGGMATGGGGAGGGVVTHCLDTGLMPTPNTGADACPGEAHTLSLPSTVLCLGGDTSTATNTHQASLDCGGDAEVDGPERVYDFTLNGTGTFKIDVRPAPNSMSTLNPSLLLQPFGCDDANGSFCFPWFASQEGFTIEAGPAAVFPGDFLTQFQVVIDSSLGTSGEYELVVSFTDPVCGDGAVNASTGEQCDDGNTVNMDGCSAGCQFEVSTVFDTCDGEPQLLPMVGSKVVLEGGNWGYAGDYVPGATSGSCDAALMNIDATGKDRLYQVVVGQSGTLSAKIGYGEDGMTDVCEVDGLSSPFCWNRVLYALGPDQCEVMGMAGNLLECSDSSAYGPEEILFPVDPGMEYYIVVDGGTDFFTDYGSYFLHLELL